MELQVGSERKEPLSAAPAEVKSFSHQFTFCLYFTYPGSVSSKKHSRASNQSQYVVTIV